MNNAENMPGKPVYNVPGIESEYYEDGVRMYKALSGKTFFADRYDAVFKPQHNLKIKQVKPRAGGSVYKGKTKK